MLGEQMGSNVLALIPARAGSKGIPNKNFTPLAGLPPVTRAWQVALAAGCDVVVSSDAFCPPIHGPVLLPRPAALSQDDTPMIQVVQHALEQIPGPADQIIVLLQPTQPLRTPAHIRAAIQLLEDSGADSVVSVVQTVSPEELLCVNVVAQLARWSGRFGLEHIPPRRQAMVPGYKRDGTCYCFRRSTVTKYGTIYGQDVRPLIIDPSETCALDTPADWAEAERRVRG